MLEVGDDWRKYSEQNSSISPFRHCLIVLAVLTVTAVLYYNVTNGYFCSYDDFIVVHRAAFVDVPSAGATPPAGAPNAPLCWLRS
jgi:hypothetical protein